MDLSFLNWAAILVAAVAAFVIGFLWHGPLFGKYWIKMMGIPQSEVDAMQAKGMGPMLPRMLAALVQQIVLATVLAIFLAALGTMNATQAILVAVLLWLGLIVTWELNSVLWEKRKLDLYFFEIAYSLVSLVAVSLILTLWR
jgi:hypothetical protein